MVILHSWGEEETFPHPRVRVSKRKGGLVPRTTLPRWPSEQGVFAQRCENALVLRRALSAWCFLLLIRSCNEYELCKCQTEKYRSFPRSTDTVQRACEAVWLFGEASARLRGRRLLVSHNCNGEAWRSTPSARQQRGALSCCGWCTAFLGGASGARPPRE